MPLPSGFKIDNQPNKYSIPTGFVFDGSEIEQPSYAAPKDFILDEVIESAPSFRQGQPPTMLERGKEAVTDFFRRDPGLGPLTEEDYAAFEPADVSVPGEPAIEPITPDISISDIEGQLPPVEPIDSTLAMAGLTPEEAAMGRPISAITGKPVPTPEEEAAGGKAAMAIIPYGFASAVRGIVPDALERTVLNPLTQAIVGKEYVSPIDEALKIGKYLPEAGQMAIGAPAHMAGMYVPLSAAFKFTNALMKAVGLPPDLVLRTGPVMDRIAGHVARGGIAGATYGGLEAGTPKGMAEDAAFFGALEGGLGAVGGIFRKIFSSNWYRNLEVPERGLVVQTADDLLRASHSEGTILRTLSDPVERGRLLEEAARKRIVPEEPAAPHLSETQRDLAKEVIREEMAKTPSPPVIPEEPIPAVPPMEIVPGVPPATPAPVGELPSPDWEVIKGGEGVEVMAKPEPAPEIPPAPKKLEREEITEGLEPLADEAKGVSIWGTAEDFANQVIEKQRLFRETSEKHAKDFAHFGYGLEYNPWHYGINFTDKKQLIDFYKRVTKKPVEAIEPIPKELEVEHKPILGSHGLPWKKESNALKAFKSKRLKEMGITEETHEVVPVKNGFGIAKKVEELVTEKEKLFPKIKNNIVDGRTVGEKVPNTDSISATLTNYEEMPGIREISMDEIEVTDPKELFYAADDRDSVRTLAKEIKESGKIAPLIVVQDIDGLYILEGAHRLGALHTIGAKSFPALMVRDLESLEKVREAKEEIVPEVEIPEKPVVEKPPVIKEKPAEVPMSSELKELHEHKARTLGFEKAGGSFVEGYLKKLAKVAEKTDMPAAMAAYDALSEYKKGNITQASLEAEKILGKLHKAEKEALMPKPRVVPAEKEIPVELVKPKPEIEEKISKKPVVEKEISQLDLVKRYVKETGKKVEKGELDKVKAKYPKEWAKIEKADIEKKELWDKLPESFRRNRGINEYTVEELETMVAEKPKEPVPKEPEVHGEYWDTRLKLGRRVDLVKKAGWITKKGGLTKLGEKIARSKWIDLSSAAQNVLKRHIENLYEKPLFKREPISETKARLLENIKDKKGSSELINDLSRLGADVMRRGHTTYKAFTAEMKTELSSVWEKIKSLIRKAYFGAKKILKSERGMLGGIKAKGTPTGQLAKAQKLLAEGKAKNEVWRETGWLKGVENKWKFEIDDSGAKFNAQKLKPRGRDKGISTADTLFSLLKHENLFKAYPQLRNLLTTIEVDDKYNNTGSFNEGQDRSSEGLFDLEPEIKIQAKTIKDVKSILFHETQHAIQEIEGFARGGSPGSPLSNTERKRLINEKMKWIRPVDEKKGVPWSESFAKASGLVDSPSERNKIYERLAGEVEAREVEIRKNLTKEQRRAMFPYAGVDGIPQDQWIVTDGKGTSFSVEIGKPPKPTPEVEPKRPWLTKSQKERRAKKKAIKEKQLKIENAKEAKEQIHGMIRDRRQNLNLAAYETNLFINDIEQQTTKTQREIIPFIIEKTDIPESLNRPDLEKAYKKDKDNLASIALQVKQHFDAGWLKMKENIPDMSAEQVENYVTHIWDLDKGQKRIVTNWFITQNRFLKKRYIETLEEGIEELGLTPKVLDISEIIRIHDGVASRAIENVKFVEGLKNLKHEGMPLIARADLAPQNWVYFDHPALRRGLVIPGKLKMGEKVSPELSNLLEEMGVAIGRRISPVAWGKPVGKAGEYRPGEPPEVRFQRFMSSRTIAHEIGHHLDEVLGLGYKFLNNYASELYAINRERIEGRIGEKGKYGEAYVKSAEEQIAEFFATLFTDASKAYRIAPNATADVLNRLRQDEVLSKLIDFDFEKQAKNLIEEQVSTLVKLPVKVHPDLEKPLKVIFESRIDHPVIQAYEVANGVLKKTNLSLSLFHHGALGETGIAIMGLRKVLNIYFNPVKIYKAMVQGKFDVFEKELIARRWIGAGLQVGATADVPVNMIQSKLNNLARKTKNVPLINKTTEFIRTFNEVWDKALWNYLHDTLKLYACESLGTKIDPTKDMTKQEQEITQFVNDTFGGQNWDTLMVSPKSLQIMTWSLLSADWTTSTVRQALSPTGIGRIHKETITLRRKLGAHFWIKAGLYFGAGINMLNYTFREWDEKEHPEYYKGMGKRTFLDKTMAGNTMGHKTHLFVGRYEDGTERYIRWGKQFRELPELFFDDTGFSPISATFKKVGGKLAPMIQLTSKITTGTSPSGFRDDDIYGKKGWDRVHGMGKVLIKSPLPFATRALFQEDKKFHLTDLAMPSSKGMTRWKSINLFKHAIIKKDDQLLKETYQFTLMNNLPAYTLFSTALTILKAESTKEFNEGIKTIKDVKKQLDDIKKQLSEIDKLENVIEIKKDLTRLDNKYKRIQKENKDRKLGMDLLDQAIIDIKKYEIIENK